MAPNTPLNVFLFAVLGCSAQYNPVWADGGDLNASTASGLAEEDGGDNDPLDVMSPFPGRGLYG